MNQSVNIVVLLGSLRKASVNKILVETALELAPEEVSGSIYIPHDLPLYNMDLEVDGFPPAVTAWQEMVDQADGMIFVTPEYNGSYSGVIKNAIDWASRGGPRLATKPVMTMGGSPGALGSTKAQEHLRAVCMHRNMYLMPQPTVAVPHLPKKIEDGALTDAQTREFLQKAMSAFYEWILKVR